MLKALSQTVASVLLACAASAQSAPVLLFDTLATGLSAPLAIVRPPADPTRLFIVQRGGTVRIWNGSVILPGNFLNVSPIITAGGERGLLSMAFHPSYATNGLFYVFYTNSSGNLELARYSRSATDSNKADSLSGVVLKTIPHPTYSNHNGGTILFGTDGLLYWSTGDGGGGGDPDNNAQDSSSLLGKMLRFSVSTGTTPPLTSPAPGNKAATPAGFDSSIFQFGLRNPFRWSFDRLTGDMWIGDVGQDDWEEVDVTTPGTAAGRDWGWRCREGAHVYSTSTVCSTGATDPVFEYDHGSSGGLSITGGYVYRGSLYPAIAGRYICADYVTARAFIVSPSGGSYTGTFQSGIPGGIAGFGEDAAGELYAVSLSSGNLYAISAIGAPLSAGGLIRFALEGTESNRQLVWEASETDIQRYRVEESRDGRTFSEVDVVQAKGAGYAKHMFGVANASRNSFYRLRMQHTSGAETFSNILRCGSGASTAGNVSLYPVPVRSGGGLTISAGESLTDISVLSATGAVVWRAGAPLPVGTHRLAADALPPGQYLLRYTTVAGEPGALRFSVE